MSKNFTQYFSRYAESELDTLITHQSCLPENFIVENVLVVPAYQETSAFIERFLASILAQSPVLMVVVINEPIKDSIDKQVHIKDSAQQKLHQFALSCGEVCWQYENLTLVKVASCTAWLLVVDRFTQGIEKDQGVGLARKIGSDLSTYLISINKVKQPWICSSDADAHLPDHYFSALHARDKSTVVCCFNFHHRSDDKIVHQANQLYETALRYYVAGLQHANSPYAFFTIGSILAFKAESYVQARGFPKRSAGEDFYLLNKLAKLGDVEFIEEVTVKLDARVSLRVPFGTGPAVQKIIELQANKQDYCYYHPEIFQQLKVTLAAFSQLWQKKEALDAWLEQLPKPACFALKSIKFEKFVTNQINSDQIQFNKQLIVWFDAFKTLKFIHSLRENYYPDIPLQQAISNANFTIHP
ncbi:MAG: hypothetical protein HRT53_08065 [Colwellia sp.]|nr:hypothetical protein [Colwellia sp.]